MDKLDFLDGAEAPNADAQPEVAEQPTEVVETPQPVESEVTETAEAKAQRERDEKGRFKAKEEKPEEAAPVMVPLTALHETRDEVKALKAQLAAMQQQPQAQGVPDMFEDPDGYQAHVQSLIVNERLNLSEAMMRQSAGDEVVNAAQEWGKQQLATNPALAHQFYQQSNPYGFLVQQYQRQQALNALGDDPKEIEAFKAWKAAQAQLQQQQPAQADPATQNPPQSIASAPSAGGLQTMPMGPGVAFDNVIK